MELPNKEHRQKGFNQSRFVSQILPEFLCKKCSFVVNSPLECPTCGILCCSVCGDKCCGVDLKQPSRVLKKIIGDLEVYCKYTGCGQIVSLEDLLAHENQCDHKTVQCAECQTPGLLKDFYTLHPQRFLCSQKCQKIAEFSSLVIKNDIKSALELYKEALQTSDSQ